MITFTLAVFSRAVFQVALASDKRKSREKSCFPTVEFSLNLSHLSELVITFG